MTEIDAANDKNHQGRPAEKAHWLDDSENVTKIYHALWAIGIALMGLDLILHRHAETGFDGWFGFYGFYGFVACVALVLAAKVLRRIVMRPENYYER